MQGALLLCAFLLACASPGIGRAAAWDHAEPIPTASSRSLGEVMQEQITSGGGAITFPVYHRSTMKDIGDVRKGQIRQQQRQRRALDLSSINASSPTSQDLQPAANDLKSTLITLNEPYGQYFAVLDIGTPSVDIAVIIDTGSQMLWLNCLPCTQCGVQAKGYAVFDPASSTSFSYPNCSTDSSCGGDDSVLAYCDSGKCSYRVTYGDKSNSSGYLAADTLTVGSAAKGASPYMYKDLIFGCGHENTGVEAQMNASGLMGLDLGKFSIITQLNVSVFAYCLPNRIRTTDVTGYLTLGKSSLTSGVPFVYSPMLQNDATLFTSQFYYMNMTGISVNGQRLDIPTAAFEITDTGNAGGTIIDSGTTFTSFVDEAYSVFVEAFDAAVDPSLVRVDSGSSNLLCYQVHVYDKAPQAPNVTLHFGDNMQLALNADLSFRVIQDISYNYYCMAFSNAGSIESGSSNFIGNYQQQDFLVEYDIANSRIGFAPHVCNQGSTSSSTSIHMRMKRASSASRHWLWLASTFLVLMM